MSFPHIHPRRSRIVIILCALLWVGPAGWAVPTFKLVASLGDPERSGAEASGPLTEGPDGRLYGLTAAGGRHGGGTLYVIGRDGSGYRAVHHFAGPGAAGTPSGPLIFGTDGRIYGTTERSPGAPAAGAIFRYTLSEQKFEIVKGLDDETSPGFWTRVCLGGVIEGSDGALYGVAGGGREFASTTSPTVVFRVDKDGRSHRIIHTFAQGRRHHPGSQGPLIEGSDGLLYGACFNTPAGGNDGGFLYRLSKTGTDFQVVFDFSLQPGEPSRPVGGVIEGSDGFLYGQLRYGTGQQRPETGAVYRIARSGAEYQVLHEFNTESLYAPVGELFEGSDGRLYGGTIRGKSSIPSFIVSGGYFALNKDGSGFTVLSRDSTREPPSTSLIQASDGKLYGAGLRPDSKNGVVYSLATSGDGFAEVREFSPTGGSPVHPTSLFEADDAWLYGLAGGGLAQAAFYKIRRDGSELTPLRFFGPEAERELPEGLYAEDAGGNILATARYAGTKGGGAVTRLSPAGKYDFFREFDAPIPDADPPTSSLARLPDGSFVGVLSSIGGLYHGMMFRLSADGTDLTPLHTFEAEPDGGPEPFHPPVLASDGRFYGVTQFGMYRLDADGTGYTFRRLFQSNLLGPESFHSVVANIMEGADGALYGVAGGGGAFGRGGVFRVDPANFDLTVVHAFKADGSEGQGARRALVQTRDGFLYGIHPLGGAVHNNGVLFRVQPNGQAFQVLHEFGHFENTPENGQDPEDLILGRDEVLYGTLKRGGANGYGALFRFGEAPEISVERENGEALATERGVIDFGETEWGAAAATLAVRVRNDGELPLAVSDFEIAGPQAADYVVVPPAQASLAPGASTLVEVRFTPKGAGVRKATLQWHNTDFDEGVFRLSLTALVPSPDIAVWAGEDPGTDAIESEQEPPISLGEARRGAALSVTLRIANEGAAPLTISQVAVPAGHSPSLAPPVVVAPGESLQLVVARDTSIVGVLSGGVGITSDDPDEPMFRFPIVSTIVDPEIAVWHETEPPTRELTSAQADPVAFGRNIQGTPGVRTFSIVNTGTAPLAVASIAVPPGYELAGPPALPVAIVPGGAATWEVRLVSLQVGLHEGSVIITSDDWDEPDFQFPVTGEVFIPVPVATFADLETGMNPVLKRQTGLREQVIRLSNDTTATVPGSRLLILGLPDGVSVANASEVRADGTAVVPVRQPLGPFSAFDLVLEYASADRRATAISPLITVEVVLAPPGDPAAEDAATFAIERVLRLPDAGGVLLEFGSAAGRLYIVQYSEDGADWQSSPVQLRGAGSRTQWIDRGPPRTASPPAADRLRFYRVLLIVE